MSDTAEQLPEEDLNEPEASEDPVLDFARLGVPLQLPVNRIQQADFTRNIWDVLVPRGTPPELLLQESYWAHVAFQLKIRDRIEVVPEDNSYFVELMVLSVGRLFAQVEIMRICNFDRPTAQVDPSAYRVSWGGGHDKWRVTRGDDVIKSGFDTEKAAIRWCENHADAVDR